MRLTRSVALVIAACMGCRRSATALPIQDGPVSCHAIDLAVDSLAAHHALDHGVPGLAVVIVAQERVVVQRAYGTRDIQTRLPVTLATPFNLASLTKPFTAIAALRLVRDGRLGLDAHARST